MLLFRPDASWRAVAGFTSELWSVDFDELGTFCPSLKPLRLRFASGSDARHGISD
ncbi:MAG: hypothetical protein ABSB74_19350 [Tepidisphaeraceae bacterium]